MTLQEIKDVVKLMHAHGIVSLKMDGLELVVNPAAAPVKRKRAKKSDTETPTNVGFKGYSDDELLSWSTRPEDT